MRNLTRLTALSGIVCVLGAIGGPAGLIACSDSSADSEGAGVSSVLFIRRQHTTVNDQGAVSVDVAGGNGQVLDYERYVPGGSLMLLSPARPDGALKNITADFTTADFN